MQHVTITRMKPLLYSLLASLMLMAASAAYSAPRVVGLLSDVPLLSALQLDVAQKSTSNAPRISPAQAAHKARQRYGGKVLSVDLQSSGYYRVKLIDNGNVRVVRIAAH